ncbi:MAG: 3-phosphoshikimate 1-carboxyvinyltransferase [Christensenellales bacterium]|jgi:3-phosphoshikimate 1-carboxyvinyltransferase
MNVTVTPAPLGGTIAAIPSKSDAHRLMICAALADKPTELALSQSSEDIDATIGCLRALGAKLEWVGSSLRISPIETPASFPILDCGESGSTLRFLLPVAAALCQQAQFIGSGRLPERPLSQLIAALKPHGVAFSAEKLPLITTGRLQSGEFTLPGNVSSQYVTGLLLALPMLSGDSRITLTTLLESAAYVDITLSALEKFGVAVQRQKDGFFIPGGRRFRSPGKAEVEGDWSNAAFFLCAGAIGGEVSVTGLNPASPQGDRRIVSLLRRFGARIEESENGITAKRSRLIGCEIDINETPDLLPALAVVAAFSQGETRFVNAARLRLKESDRLTSTASLINALGGSATELPSGLVVRGKKLTGGYADSFRDHRIAMAAAVAAVGCEQPVIIAGAECAAKSYPAFYRDFCKLGGIADVI